MFFQVFSIKQERKHTYSNGVPGVFKINENHTYSNRFPGVWGPGKSWQANKQMWRPDSTKTFQDPQNMEHHRNMYGSRFCFIETPGKPLECVCFLFLCYKIMETHWIMYVFQCL